MEEVPDSIFVRTDDFLSKKVGADFFNLYIHKDYFRSRAADSIFEIRYNFKMDEYDFVDEEILIITDKHGNLDHTHKPSGIPTCVKRIEGCNFINREAAVRIAEENGLDKGIKPWLVEFRWFDEANLYVWHILSTKYELKKDNYYIADGEELLIDPVTVEVIKHREWKVR